MNILLIQNEPSALSCLEQHVRQYYPSDSIASFTDSSAALDYIKKQSPPVDLCFTPVKTDGPSALQVARELRLRSGSVKIVLTAKTNEYAIDAWTLRVNDYLLEPVTAEGVRHTLTSCAPCRAPSSKEAANTL